MSFSLPLGGTIEPTARLSPGRAERLRIIDMINAISALLLDL